MNRVSGRWVLAIAVATALLASLGIGVTTAAAATTAKVRNGTLMVTGDSAGDKVSLSLQAGPPSMIQVDVGEDGIIDFAFDRSTFSTIEVDAHGGGDEVRVENGITGQPITINGGPGSDTLIGGNDAEHFIGGGGNDFVDGNVGADTALLGTGNDTFNWDPGDASDTIEGEGGRDTLQFNASNIAEKIEFKPNGTRVLMTRDVATVTMDLNGIETANVNALGGADTVTVSDLAGTGLSTVNVNLATISGGDGVADTVVVNGTAGPDNVSLANAAGALVVNGLVPQTRVTGDEAGLDVVDVNTLAGNDQLNQPIGVTSAGSVSYDGGVDQDSLAFVGTAGDDQMGITANGTAAATFSPTGLLVNSQTTVEKVVVTGLTGNDHITAQGNLAAITSLTLDGGNDDDTLLGGNGNDLLLGGSGNDFVDGNVGADTALLGTGNDTFNWDPGDASDTIEGEGGHDTLQFNASNIAEKIDLSANGTRLRLTRDVAIITTDAAGIETVNARLLGGADTLTINDLTGTDVTNVNADLAGFDGNGDAAADTVIVNGTAGPDNLTLANAAGALVVNGLVPQTRVTGDEAGLDVVDVNTLAGNDQLNQPIGVTSAGSVSYDGGVDQDSLAFVGTAGDDQMGITANGTAAATFSPTGLLVNSQTTVEKVVVTGLTGNDHITAQGNLAAITSLTLDGGNDDDTLLGGNGNDLLLGGSGNDFVDGNVGADTALLGTGNDTFNWDPGDASDTIEGEGGHDTLQFNASNIAEKIDLSANGTRLRLTRDVAIITTDAAGIETVNARLLGGADTLTINDLTGTDVTNVNADLAGFDGNGDAAADTVIVNGTNGADQVGVTTVGTQVLIGGLQPQVQISGSEPANDTLRLQTLDGDDSVTVDPGVNGLINPIVDLGPGE